MGMTTVKSRNSIFPLIFFLVFLGITAIATVVAAADASPKIDTGDTAWVLTASAMVLLMTPGLAFFYGGLVRRKNILSVLMQCFVIICIVSIQWVYFGYSLSFGPDVRGLIGDLSWFGLKGVGAEPHAAYAATIPHIVFMVFQMMFAVITPALVIGAFAERMKFSALCLFALLWATFVYAPVTHWVWGVGGIWGVLATGLFATKAVNPAGADGLFYGGTALLGAQVKGTLITTAWSLVGTYVILKALDMAMGLRVSEHEERIGLDLTGHRESAYTLLD